MPRIERNKFGKGIMHSENDLIGSVYISCAACMSLYAETAGWIDEKKYEFESDPTLADSIVVIGCQVTDLAILNDFRIIEKYRELNPDAVLFIGGCLGQRFDISLPEDVKRITHLQCDYSPVDFADGLIHYEAPFWIPDFDDTQFTPLKDGYLFRNMYPLRIGVGCNGNCQYCTIKETRGKAYELIPNLLEYEFNRHDSMVIIADSINASQIEAYCNLAIKHDVLLAFRNVEPHNVILGKDHLLDLAVKGLLSILHTPIQSMDHNVLEVMNRSYRTTSELVPFIKELKSHEVFTATNIIVDYSDGTIKYHNDFEFVYGLFDYVSWNPYWDGYFNIHQAEVRYEHYSKFFGNSFL